MLGICYGMQLMCQALGGRVQSHAGPRVRPRALHDRHDNSEAADLFAGVPHETEVWMSHGDQVTRYPDDFVPLARTDDLPSTPP